jgi:very-short-patch-repair endonuclease
MTIVTNYAANSVACKLWDDVGSPTEYILGLEIFNVMSKKASVFGFRCWVYSDIEFTFAGPQSSVIAIVPQKQIAGVGTVDFAIYLPGNSEPVMVVECDGHEVHSTVEQSSKDRRRDRTLQRRGVLTFRYTGTDIVRTSVEAAHEISDEVIKKRIVQPPQLQKPELVPDF